MLKTKMFISTLGFALAFAVILLGLTTGAAWAQTDPSPLPLDPAQLPAGTEAFISQTLLTQLRGVEEPGNPGDPSGLNFQDIGLPAALEYNNIGYDPVTRYLYGVEVFGNGAEGGNRGLVRIGLDPADPTQILVQPLGWPGYPDATLPWGASGNAYPRFDAGDVDPDNRLFYVHTQGQQVGCTGNLSVCTDRVRSFDIDALPSPGDPPANLTAAYGVSRLFKAVQGGPALNIVARVADWAYRDGKLYGGDAASGRLAVNTPNAVDDDPDPSDDDTHALFNLFTFDPAGVASALDTTVAGTADAYGAAWFIGDILYLYKNGGENAVAPKVYKIDLQIDEVTGDPFPKIIEIAENVNVDVVTRNDGASFMAQGPVPFECTDTAYLVQADGETSSNNYCAVDLTSCPTTLSYIDQTAANFNIVDIANTGVDEINAIGYNTLDNFLYGVQVQLDPVTTSPWTNSGIVRIDANGAVTNLGNPTQATGETFSWPAHGFNTGDLMPGTHILYLQLQGGTLDQLRHRLYIVDLAASPMTFTSKAYNRGEFPGAGNVVLDWAAHNGLLYGADRQGQIAVLDPTGTSAVRTDKTVAGLAGSVANPLPGSDGYGAAWFNSAGELFVYQNSGTIYKIDLGPDPSDSSDWTLVSSQSGESTTRNDGAACAAEVEPAALTVSKTAETAIARTYDWTIDKTANSSELTLMPGQTFQVSYEVAVNALSSDVNSVSGGITIVNNTQEMATIESVTDEISGGPTVADIECQVSFQYDLPVGETLICDYSAVLPDASTQTNTATVTTSGDVAGGTATAAVDFANATLTEIDKCIDVSDDKGTGSDIFLEEVCGADKVITYYLDIGPFSCGSNTFVNTASFVTGDQSLSGSDDWTIPINVDCDDGCSLTPGYWKTHSEYGPAPYDDTWALLEFEADTPFFLSGQSYYEVLWTEPQGDAYYILAHAYIAAQLNQLNGADFTDTEAQDAFAAATNLFAQYEPAEVSGAKGKNGKELREQFIVYATTLDNYNNGYIGPGHCSEEEVYIVPGGGSSLIHVGDLDASASSGRRDRWNAKVTITVHDASDGAVADATVWGEWSDGSSGSCPTNNSGQCAIDRNNIWSGDSITFTVTDVTHGAFTYSAADNHDEEDGDASDGTSIAVLKP